MEKIFAAHFEASSKLVELPTELTINIISRVAAQLRDAIVDLRNLSQHAMQCAWWAAPPRSDDT
jgi:hypothetical protein